MNCGIAPHIRLVGDLQDIDKIAYINITNDPFESIPVDPPIREKALAQLLGTDWIIVNRAEHRVFVFACLLDRTKNIWPTGGRWEVRKRLAILRVILSPDK